MLGRGVHGHAVRRAMPRCVTGASGHAGVCWLLKCMAFIRGVCPAAMTMAQQSQIVWSDKLLLSYTSAAGACAVANKNIN